MKHNSKSSSFICIIEAIANNKASYYRALDNFYNYYDRRPDFIYQHMKEYMGLKGNEVYLTIEIQGKGRVQINSIIPKFKNNKWTGKYLSLIPITIKAIPDVGYNFQEWEGFVNSAQEKEEFVLFNSSKIIAIFE